MTATALALMALLAGAEPAPASAPVTSFKCKGEGPKDKQTPELRKRIEGGDFFKFALQQLGAPRSCAVKWTHDEGDFATLTYKLEKGSASFVTLPPETEITTLEAGGGFADEAAVRAFFKRVETVKQFKIDWKQKPEVAEEK